MTKVSKKELAEHIGKSNAIITRLVKDGILNSCFTSDGKKIYLEKAIKSIIMNKGSDYIKVDVSEILQNSDDEYQDETLYTAKNIEELQELLDAEPSPSKKIDMMDKFWSYKIRHQKFMEADGELISVTDAKAAIETLLAPLNNYLNDLGNNLKNHFPEIPIEVKEWLDNENNRQKKQLRVKEWD